MFNSVHLPRVEVEVLAYTAAGARQRQAFNRLLYSTVYLEWKFTTHTTP